VAQILYRYLRHPRNIKGLLEFERSLRAHPM
jgi:hypothetical protein